MRTGTIILGALAVLLAAAGPAHAGSPTLTARSAVVMSKEGVVLWKKSPSFTSPPASTTKVMTALVVLRRLKLDAWVKVSWKAEHTEPTRAGIRAGEQYKVKDLLYALLMKSGNDVAVCLAEGVSGTEARFSTLMNERAKKLGCTHTTFKKASGLPARGQKTTARDLCVIMLRALKEKVIKKALKTRTLSIFSRTGRKVTLRNHNRLLWDRRYDVTLKTGYTRASRHCYVGYMGPDGRDGVFAFLTARKPWDDARAIGRFAASGGAKIDFNRRNLSSRTVTRIQEALHRKGLNPGPVDGIFGRKTLLALERFQKSHKLTADGLAGEKTLKKLGVK